jgi:putative transposase
MVTRRTVQRTFLLRPDPQIQQIYLYCIAVFAARYDIAVHVPVLMSTHEHLMVTDTRGELPSFVRDLHRTVALCVKALYGWKGPVWDHQRTSVVKLATPEATVETAAYMIANPVTAGLVPTAAEWPGVTIAAAQLGRARWTIARPPVYFSRTNGLWPESATLELATPTQLSSTQEAARALIAAQVKHAEDLAASELRSRGLKFLGSAAATQCSPFERAKGIEPTKRLNPTFAVGNRQREARLNALAGLHVFRQAYREALVHWRDGVRDIAFPPGTWQMVRLHGARAETETNALARAS